MFKKRALTEIKQPQEFYCSNLDCTNEIGDFSPLAHLLTDDAYENLSSHYCIDCIIEEKRV